MKYLIFIIVALFVGTAYGDVPSILQPASADSVEKTDDCACEDCKCDPCECQPAAAAFEDGDDVIPVGAEMSWEGQVEEALRYLHTNQLDLIKRVEAIEKQLLQVQQVDGSIATKTVPISNGEGTFSLKPGEKIVAVQDPVTGRWYRPSSSSSYVSTPTRYSTPTSTVRTTYSRTGLFGRVTTRYRSCGPNGCR